MQRHRITLPTSPRTVVFCRPNVHADHFQTTVDESHDAARSTADLISDAAGAADDVDNLLKEKWESLEELLTSIQVAIADLDQHRHQSLEELQQASVELAIAVASQIVRVALDQNQYGIDRLVRDAIARLPASGSIQVTLHPDDLALIREMDESGQIQPPLKSSVTLEGDASLERGSCRAVAPDQSIVSDIRTQLAELRELLLEGIHDAQTERRKPEADNRGLQRFPNRRETA